MATEKTFEELIEENEFTPRGYNKDTISVVNSRIVKDLLQQVREATKAECAKIYDADWGKYVGYKKMLELPTDRILITENEE